MIKNINRILAILIFLSSNLFAAEVYNENMEANKQLVGAIKTGNLDALKLALSNRADLSTQIERDLTAIH